jgi:hypothetical protein
MITLWDVVHLSPEEQDPHEFSSLCRTEMVAVCVILGSADNEHSGNDLCR